MTPDTFIKAALAAHAHREAAHHGGVDNMMAVAFVMRNRSRAGWHGGNWLEIIQRSDETAGTIHKPSAPNLQDIAFRLLLQQIDDVHAGLTPDKMTEGALFYAELDDVNNDWFKSNILAQLESHPRVATVGAVSFFR